MEQIVDFPDPATYNYPEEVKLPDGTLLMGRTPGESPLIMNRKKWRLYPTFKVISYDYDKLELVVQSTQNGVIYKMPKDPITQSILYHLLDNPGSTPEQVVSELLAWGQQNGIDLLSNNDRMFTWASYMYDTISLLITHGLIKIEK